MKVFVVVALCAFVATCQALNDKEKAAIGKLYTDCVASSNVDESLIKRLRSGEDIVDDKLKTYVGCMFTRLNFVNAAGELNEEAIRAKIPSDFNRDEADKIIAECKNVKGEDANGVAFAAYTCFLKKTTKLIEF